MSAVKEDGKIPSGTVRKAVVLAAGFGTRLKPFTCTVPKPLLPVWGEAMLLRIVNRLREMGVEDIVVNCHHLHDHVERWCAENGCRAVYEKEILGTGGVLNPLREWLAGEDFYLVNGDIVIEGFDGFPCREDVGRRGGKDGDILGVCLVTEEGPRTVEVERESSFATNWRSDDAGMEGTFTYSGFALLSSKVLDYIAPSGFSSIVEAYEKAMLDGWFVKCFSPEDLLWTDAGTVSSYIDINSAGEENAFADIPHVKESLASAGKSADEKISFLGVRGSERAFFAAADAVVVVYDDTNRRENALYASHARFLSERGIPVPKILAFKPELKTLVLENAGKEKETTLEEKLRIVESLYSFNSLGKLFLDGANGTLPELSESFGPETWKWERELFEKYSLQEHFSIEMPDDVARQLESVGELLEREEKSLVHRDFQSSNILWKGSDFSFIDFQGMRLGPAVYDLASFVYDPYVNIPERHRDALILHYSRLAQRPEIVSLVPYAAVQRLVQCLGAYGRLASVGQKQFSKYIMPALENLLDAADKANLDAVGALAEDLIAAEKRMGGR
jgi:aminoglycoside/choline kinase family phosphotransferase